MLFANQNQQLSDDTPVSINGRVLFADGSQAWLKDGVYHREDGPALIMPDGQKEWYINGDLHRWKAPAIITADGKEFWFQHGKRHRKDGPAVTYPSGTHYFYLHGALYEFAQWIEVLDFFYGKKHAVMMKLKWY